MQKQVKRKSALDFAKDCKYIKSETHLKLYSEYEEVGKMKTQENSSLEIKF